MADTSGVLTGLQAIADRRIQRTNIVSKIYERSPLLAMMAARAGSGTKLRVGGFNLVGGRNMSSARRQVIAGSEKVYLPPVQTGTLGDSKHMAARDTGPENQTPTITATDKIKRPFVQKSKLHTPILIWNTDLEAAKGEYELLNVVDNSTQLAMEDHQDVIISILWDGKVADDTADIWKSQYGIAQVIDDDSMLYGIDRAESASTTYFDGHRSTDAVDARLDMIDQANLIEGIAKTGPGIDVLLCNAGAYHTIKSEALSKNGTMVHRGTPDAARLGIQNEAVMYGGTVITWDPGLKDYDGYADTNGSSMGGWVVGLTLDDWVFMTEEGAAFNVGEFTDLEASGEAGKDAVRAHLKTHYRFWCERPWNQIIWTNVQD